MLWSGHAFFAPVVKDSLLTFQYWVDPEYFLNAPPNKFIDEERSEYHPLNISNYPKHKKVMDEWLRQAAYNHKKFEEGVRAKNRHLLDLSAKL